MQSDVELNTNLGRWLGLLITDGTINKNKRFLNFANINDTLLKDSKGSQETYLD